MGPSYIKSRMILSSSQPPDAPARHEDDLVARAHGIAERLGGDDAQVDDL
jgi:hypothetical protein